MRGKDYGLLDLPQVKEHLTLAADEQFTHPESGTCRDLFDCGELPVTAEGHRSRVIVATHQVSTTASPVGVTRDGVAYELFFTALPASGFTAADVVKLASRIGAASRRCLPMRIASKIVIGGVPTRRMVRKPGKSLRNGCGICVKNSASSGNRPPCVSPNLLLLKLRLSPPPISPQRTRPSVPRSGRVRLVLGALGERTLFPSLTALCAVHTAQRSTHRNADQNMMERCGCSMLPVSLTVARVPCAHSVKDMAPLPTNPVASALSCILSHNHHLSLRLKSVRLRTCLPPIRFSGLTGRAVSHAGPGYSGSEVTWSP